MNCVGLSFRELPGSNVSGRVVDQRISWHTMENEGKRYNIIYADPPWRFRSWGPKSSRRPPYRCLSTADICALPVRKLCADDCILFLWAIYPMLPDAFKVIRAWGFTFKTVAFTWV